MICCNEIRFRLNFNDSICIAVIELRTNLCKTDVQNFNMLQFHELRLVKSAEHLLIGTT